jgi:uncharacterized phage infection (PIP) family protein YhgE
MPGVRTSIRYHVQTLQRYNVQTFKPSNVPTYFMSFMPNPHRLPKSNLNALKNGFYSPLLLTSETIDLNEGETSSLEHEITLLRVMIRRTMQLANGIHDLHEAIRVLDSLGAAMGRLSTLLRAQKSLSEGHSQLTDEISIAIQHANAELRNKNV